MVSRFLKTISVQNVRHTCNVFNCLKFCKTDSAQCLARIALYMRRFSRVDERKFKSCWLWRAVSGHDKSFKPTIQVCYKELVHEAYDNGVKARGSNGGNIESPSSTAYWNVQICTNSKTARNLMKLRLRSPESHYPILYSRASTLKSVSILWHGCFCIVCSRTTNSMSLQQAQIQTSPIRSVVKSRLK